MISRISTAALALALLIVLPSSVLAQDRHDDRRSGPTGAGFFSVGAIMVDIDALNNQLAAQDYPTFDDRMLTLGAGGYGVIADVLLIGGEGYGHIAGMESFEGRDVTLGGGYGFFNLGALIDLTPNVRFYPLAGIGGGGLALDIGAEPADDFDDVLDDPGQRASIAQGSLLFNLGGGLEFTTAPEGGGFLIGLRAGYVFSGYDTNWMLDGDSLAGSPDSNLEGPYLRLLIGGAMR